MSDFWEYLDEDKEMSKQVECVEVIQGYIEESNEFGMTAEVIFYALQSMKRDNTQDIQQCFEDAYNDLIK